MTATGIQKRTIPAAAGDNILIDRAKLAEVSTGGIILPQIKRKARPPAYGVVVSVGPAVKEVAVGDIVFFSDQEANTLEVSDTTLHVLLEVCVWAKMSKADARKAGLDV